MTYGPSPAPGGALAGAPAPAPAAAAPNAAPDAAQGWTAGTICLSLALFLAAGLAEIGGGWLVWQALREHRGWWMAVLGAGVLFLYGVIPTFQPKQLQSFGRVYAVYGGFFVLLSYLWGWAVDGDRPDVGDWVGTAVAVAGVSIAWFWPR